MSEHKRLKKALLNDEGKKVWGYVFPDGAIPVRNVVPFKALAFLPT